jgi:phosphate transport system permease protein
VSTQSASAKSKVRLGDLIFSRAATFAGAGILAILAAVALFLFLQALPALDPNADFDGKAENPISFVTPYLFGTLYGSLIALAIATPLAVGIALYISHFASRRFS